MELAWRADGPASPAARALVDRVRRTHGADHADADAEAAGRAA